MARILWKKENIWINITKNEKWDRITDRIESKNIKVNIRKNSRPLNFKTYEMVHFLKQRSNLCNSDCKRKSGYIFNH